MLGLGCSTATFLLARSVLHYNIAQLFGYSQSNAPIDQPQDGMNAAAAAALVSIVGLMNRPAVG